jgi:hypothetical protein
MVISSADQGNTKNAFDPCAKISTAWRELACDGPNVILLSITQWGLPGWETRAKVDSTRTTVRVEQK